MRMRAHRCRRARPACSPPAILRGAADRPAAPAAAQTPFVPYFGKNNIHYDTFDWQIYTTDHFEIYYYPEIETAPRAGRRLRRERVPAGQRRPASTTWRSRCR